MTEAQWLSDIASRYPDAAALALGEQIVSNFAELADDAARLAAGLRERGHKTADRIAIFAANTPPYITALYGIWWGGFAAVPVNAKLHHDEIVYILNHAGISHVFISPETEGTALKAARDCKHEVSVTRLDRLKEMMCPAVAPHDTAPGDLAWLFYTSGTTGRPKGAMLTYKNLDQMTTRFLQTVTEVSLGDAIIHAAPLSHGSGIYTLPHLRSGACQVIPQSGGFEVDELTELLDHWRGVAMFAAPTMVNRWVRSDAEFTAKRLENLKIIVYGGAPMYIEDAERAFNRLGPRLAQIYGQGESPMTITCLNSDDIAATDDPDWQRKLSSVGTAFPNVEVGIKTEDGRIRMYDATGEVVVRGDIVMAGYWRDPEATAAAIQDDWLHTGDIGQISTDGYLTLLDRSKDLIISGGANIYPREVEEVLLTHPEVEDVSVIGRPDEDWGEIVVAYYVGTADPVALDVHCLDHIARFKRPKDYIRIKSLPKSHYGKILKTALRKIDRDR
jgi:long-chain acyl-CoA synthetase